MAMYAVSTRNMINSINQNYQNISQVWFADDSAVGGLVADSASVLDHLEKDGPKDGYHPKPPKCKFIPTSEENKEKAKIAFKGKEVKIVVIRETFIPAILGKQDTDDERLLYHFLIGMAVLGFEIQ